MSKYTSQLGCAFDAKDDETIIHVRSFQLMFDGHAVATADFDNGVCKRFMFADSHAEAAQRWHKGFKWVCCGLCYGRGKQREYGDEWRCPPCDGTGGFITDSFSDFQPAEVAPLKPV